MLIFGLAAFSFAFSALLGGCSSPGGAPPAASKLAATVSHDTQVVADAIRHAETVSWTPAQFSAYVHEYTAIFPTVAPYVDAAVAFYATAYVGGAVTAEMLEWLARKYDSPPSVANPLGEAP